MSTTKVVFNNGDPRMKTLVKSCPLPQPLSSLKGSQAAVASDKKSVCVLGFPCDFGTVRNGGRPGGFAGPAAFQRFLNSKGPVVNPEHNIDLSNVEIINRGNVTQELRYIPGSGNEMEDDLWSNKLETAHEHLYTAVVEALQGGMFPFCIGGSNDQSFPNAKALLDTYGAENVSVINIDAHLDVRPLVPRPDDESTSVYVHSGSPFRQLLEYPGFVGKNFSEFAVQGMQCSKEHADYALSKGSSIHWLGDIQNKKDSTGFSISASQQFLTLIDSLSMSNQKVFISFDIDSVRASDAPGVSCPSPVGLTADDALEMAYIAGKHPNVALFDISELCPAAEDYRTPMLATFMFYKFLLGYSQRQ